MCVWWGEGGGAGQTGIEKEINREMENRDRQTERTERTEREMMTYFFISSHDVCVCGVGGGGRRWTDGHRIGDK